MIYYTEIPEVWATEFLELDPDCAGYWVSSLTQSWQRGYADNCTLPWTVYVDFVRRLRLQSQKKIIVDVDMLFNEPSIAAVVAKELFYAGCNTIVVESKRFPKVNSLTPDTMVLSTPEEFCRLINKVKKEVPELEVIARNEYLATSKDVAVTCDIARRSSEAGADGVVIHWGGNSDTSLLKESLEILKKDELHTGIIPTKYLDQVVRGDFDSLADFSILGNICSSFIRKSFSQKSLADLLSEPCEFQPILERVGDYEPQGHKTLVVLGAKPDKNGNFLLDDDLVTKRFIDRRDDFFSMIFVVDAECLLDASSFDKANRVEITSSLGETHSLMAALPHIHTEHVTVAYADIENIVFQNLDAGGLLFLDDQFAGIINLQADLLLSLLEKANPDASLLEMVSQAKIPYTAITSKD